MRLTTLRLDGAEPGALVRPGGAVPLPALNRALGTDWPETVQELLERGRVEELLRGADGIMTGFGFPQVLVGTYERFVAGDRAGAQEFFFRYLPLIRYEAQLGVGGVTIRKQVFARRGAIASPHARFPAPPVDELTLAELDDLIAAVGL